MVGDCRPDALILYSIVHTASCFVCRAFPANPDLREGALSLCVSIDVLVRRKQIAISVWSLCMPLRCARLPNPCCDEAPSRAYQQELAAKLVLSYLIPRGSPRSCQKYTSYRSYNTTIYIDYQIPRQFSTPSLRIQEACSDIATATQDIAVPARLHAHRMQHGPSVDASD